MDPSMANEMQQMADSLIIRARTGAQCKTAASICVTSIGPSALEYLTRSLDLAMLHCEPNVSIALGMAIIEIWESSPQGLAVAKNKEKIRSLFCERPSRIDPAIDMVRYGLLCASGKCARRRASEDFLRGPADTRASVNAAQAHRLKMLRN
ncbi:MAG: hypothetical protein NTX79_07055 [Candidatus Micrarchaeota archaeon]|nr:hypothetical protein [Candidatus Micrarchaeota archaeon]